MPRPACHRHGARCCPPRPWREARPRPRRSERRAGAAAPRQRAWALALAWVWAWTERARPRATQPRPHGAGLVRVACPGVPRVRRTGQAWCGVRSGGGGGGVLEAGGENDEVPRRPAPAKQTELLGKPCLRAPLASNTERVAPTGSEQPTTFDRACMVQINVHQSCQFHNVAQCPQGTLVGPFLGQGGACHRARQRPSPWARPCPPPHQPSRIPVVANGAVISQNDQISQ